MFDKDHIRLKIWFKGNLYNQKKGDMTIFTFPLAIVVSFGHTVACDFYTFGHQPARLVCVFIKM